jgi:simple sugar transport system ATP-binding protein/ribose transport system ATP-binding protein
VRAGDPILRVAGVSKSFGGAQAVRNVSLSIERGSVHALVGENGAGKSTLAKIIAGLLQPDEGELFVDGYPVSFGSPRDALAKGIATIEQELALVPGLTVAQNVYLGAEPRRWGFINRRALAQRYRRLAEQTGFDLPGEAVTAALRTADAQKVEIMRAVSRDASLIIMDEPTAALSHDDTGRLHQIILDLVAAGRTVVLISHFLSEVLALADTVSILRDGALVRTGPAAAETEATLIEAMLGRSLGSVFPPRRPPPDPTVEPVLSVTSLSAPGVTDISLTVRPGEIVGLAGLVGAGRTELAYALYGNGRRTRGTVTFDGRTHNPTAPREALRDGMFLIPESRKDSGLVLGRSLTENVTLATLHRFSRLGVVAPGRQRRATAELAERLSIRARPDSPLWSLSGGNQQKALFARGLLRTPRLLIADEPTRGVDVGSRRAIYDLIAEQASAGLGVLVISSDFEELVGLAHRVLVMRGGRIVAELSGDRMTEHEILTAAFTEENR